MPLPANPPSTPASLSQNARTVLAKRYLVKDKSGSPVETPEEMFWRVAYNIALAEAVHGGTHDDVIQMARRFFEMLTELRFFPNSPTLSPMMLAIGRGSYKDYRFFSLEDRTVLMTDVSLRNDGTYPIRGRAVAVFGNLSDPAASVLNPDGYLPDGRVYLDLTPELSGAPLVIVELMRSLSIGCI